MDNRIEDLNIKETYSTKHEQVDAAVRFVLRDNKAYYVGLSNLPSRVKESILTIVLDWEECSGYHFNVLKAAYRQYSRELGYITVEEPPFTDEEINP